LVDKTGSLLLLDAPTGIQFGIDNQFWQTGPLFRGVKLIPPGAHFVYYALKDEEFAARMGFFIYIDDPSSTRSKGKHGDSERDFGRDSVVVRRWKPEE